MIYVCDTKRHLVCVPYTLSNLHLMARYLGIKKKWYHGGKYPHYDIPKRRVAEITSRFYQTTPKKLLQIIKDGLRNEAVALDKLEFGSIEPFVPSVTFMEGLNRN